MEHLCDDVLLVIAKALDIDAFLNYRLVCRRFHDLTNRHIRSLAMDVACSTFPAQAHLISDESLRLITSSADGLLWLKRLRYEYLGAVVLQSTCRGITADVSERRATECAANGLDPISVLARGWNLIARLSELLRTAHEKFRLRYRNDSRNCDLESEERTMHYRLCRQWLDVVGNSPILDVYGFDWLCRCLIMGVFGFTGYSHHYSSQFPGDFNCIAWLSTWIIQVGPGPFWHQWTGGGHLNSSAGGDIAVQIETAWHMQQRPLPRWERDKIRCVERLTGWISCSLYNACRFTDPPMQDLDAYGLESSILCAAKPSTIGNAAFRFAFPPENDRLDHQKPDLILHNAELLIPVDWSLLGYLAPRKVNRPRHASCHYMGELRSKPLSSRFRHILHGWLKERDFILIEHCEDMIAKLCSQKEGRHPPKLDWQSLYGYVKTKCGF